MALTDALDRYFAAWNDHDPEGVVATLTTGGTYEDPTTGGPLSGDALAASVRALITGFPDVRFDMVTVAPTGDDSAAAQWRMRGTNTGPMPGGPPTGGSIDLPGADFITYDAGADRVSSVVGYFDTATMLGQLGLQAHISPADMDPLISFGIGLRVDTTRADPPGAVTVTWIEIAPEHVATLTDVTTGIVMELLENPGYLGSCIMTVGARNYTFTAWDSVDTARHALRGGAHGAAMRMARSDGLGPAAFGITSIWVPERLNGVFRADKGTADDLATLEGQWL